MIGEEIIADASGNPGADFACSQTPAGAGLVRTLAAGQHLKLRSEHGLAGGGKGLDGDDEVHIEAAEDGNYRGHAFKSIPRRFSSSA